MSETQVQGLEGGVLAVRGRDGPIREVWVLAEAEVFVGEPFHGLPGPRLVGAPTEPVISYTRDSSLRSGGMTGSVGEPFHGLPGPPTGRGPY